MYQVLTGAQMYSVRTLTQSAENMEQALKRIAEIGYTSVQLSGHDFSIDPARIRDMLDRNGLKCNATHVGFADLEKDLPRFVKLHRTYGCDHPGIGSMPADFAHDPEGIRAFARRANELGRKLKDEGMTFIYHNHAFEFRKFGGVTGMDILFDELTDVQFELDVYWIQAGGADPVEWIRKVAGRMDVVHFKEMVGCLATPAHPSMTEMAPIGEGNLNWHSIQQACDDTGVRWAFIEQDNAVETDPIDCMRRSFVNLSALGGRFR